ncbi:uncharacterized protein LOC129618243 [Condylostylus longicornis]|uniref:uncharacterized protein LOC129618243 n=1 Tax=Condylostylus longicornis TaxID=2530218 RepID=UPI00244E1972|nr:uncharacterized protein LOC129618243 [Condylostylus longicornis]
MLQPNQRGNAGSISEVLANLDFSALDLRSSTQEVQQINQIVENLLARSLVEPELPEMISATNPDVAAALRSRDKEALRQAVKAEHEKKRNATIMSKRCAERCNLMSLVDTRFSGIARCVPCSTTVASSAYFRGVGTARIVGRIHMVQLKMGNQFFAASLTVLEDDKVDFLFGLDLLRRHQCLVDLRENVLRIGHEALPFLSEKDINAPDSNQPVAPQPSSESAPQIRRQDGRQQISEEKVKRLVDLGFPRGASIRALEASAWDVEIAAALLFQQHEFS